MEDALKYHKVKLRTIQKSDRMSESVVQNLLNSGKLCAMTTFLGRLFLTSLLVKNTYLYQPESLLSQLHGIPSGSLTGHQREISATPLLPIVRKL